MRSIAVALTAALLAGGAAYAHGRTHETAAVGTMTCSVRADVSLVFGRSPVADCTFVSEGGETQRYAAIFARGRDVPKAQTVSWRVVADAAAVRSGLLAGRFAATADSASLAKAGGAVVLKPLTAGVPKLALGRPQVEFAAMPGALAAR